MCHLLSDSHKQLQQAAKDFVGQYIRTSAFIPQKMDQKKVFPWDWFRACGSNHFLSEFFPSEYGGRTSSALGMVLVLEEISRASCSLALILAAHLQACFALNHSGTPAQKENYLYPALKGEKLFAFAATEECSGSDVSGISTTALQLGAGSWQLDGSKRWITNSENADCFLVTANVPHHSERQGLALFLVDKDSPGLHISPSDNMMGMNNALTGSISFSQCTIPADNIIISPITSSKLLNQTLRFGQLIVSAIAVGGSEQVFEYALEYSKKRVQFGRPISSFQGVSLQIADMFTKVDIMRTMLYHVAKLWDAKESYSLSTINLKVFSTDTFCSICDAAMLILGGIGYSKEYDVERYLRDSRALRITSSTPQVCGVLLQNYLYYDSKKDI